MRVLVPIALTAATAAALFACRAEQAATADFCTELLEVRDIDELVASLDPTLLAEAGSHLAALRSAAPDSLRDDLGELERFVTRTAEAVGANPGAETGAVESVAREIDLDRLEEAGGAVERYAAAECGVVLTTSTTTTPPPSTAPETAAPGDG